jgi:hypothetical protein
MHNVRETGWGLVIANFLFTIPVVWVSVVLGYLANQFVNWIMPIPNGNFMLTTQFDAQSIFRADYALGFGSMGLLGSQVCFFLIGLRPGAVLFPQLRFHLLTYVVLVLIAGGVLLLNLHHRVEDNFSTGEYAMGYPVYFLFRSTTTMLNWGYLALNILFWAPVFGATALLIEYALAPRAGMNSANRENRLER